MIASEGTNDIIEVVRGVAEVGGFTEIMFVKEVVSDPLAVILDEAGREGVTDTETVLVGVGEAVTDRLTTEP